MCFIDARRLLCGRIADSRRRLPLLMVPKEGLTLIAGAGDDHALTLMLDTAERTYAESEEYRSLRAVVWERENRM